MVCDEGSIEFLFGDRRLTIGPGEGIFLPKSLRVTGAQVGFPPEIRTWKEGSKKPGEKLRNLPQSFFGSHKKCKNDELMICHSYQHYSMVGMDNSYHLYVLSPRTAWAQPGLEKTTLRNAPTKGSSSISTGFTTSLVPVFQLQVATFGTWCFPSSGFLGSFALSHGGSHPFSDNLLAIMLGFLQIYTRV